MMKKDLGTRQMGFAPNQRGRQGEIMLDGSIICNVGLKLYTYTRVSWWSGWSEKPVMK